MADAASLLVRVVGGLIALAAVIAAAYAIAAGLVATSDDAPSWLVEKPIAHRGLHTEDRERPENSMAAFRSAVASDFPIELDVHLSADGTVVVFHDDTLARMTGDARALADVDASELTTLVLLESEETIPTLAGVLSNVDGAVPILIEIKQRGEVGDLEQAVVDALMGYQGEVAVQSFNPYSLSYVAAAAPTLPRGQLSGTFAEEDLPGWQIFALRTFMMNWKSRPSFVAYELNGLPSRAASLQRSRGRELLGWSASTAEEFERAQKLCDGVIFDPGAF